jgi:hypothetical protein
MEDFELSERLGELSLTLQYGEQANLSTDAFSTSITPLMPIPDGTPVVAIDVSSIKIGETEMGALYAVRGAIVMNDKHQIKYLRLGPFPFHITEKNKKEIFRTSKQDPSLNLNSGFSSPLETQSHLCNIVERWIQMSVATSSINKIILWDGSLTVGTIGNSMNVLSQILRVARKNGNSILSFSKETNVRFSGRRITEIIPNCKPPYVLEANELHLKNIGNLRLLGKVYVARLTNTGCSFRLDIDRFIPLEQRILAVQRLLGNELVFQGYPETLRLAHIFSTFTANDIMGIQHFITQEYGLRVIAHNNIRRMLFGPFGKGSED